MAKENSTINPIGKAENAMRNNCNIFEGKWPKDNEQSGVSYGSTYTRVYDISFVIVSICRGQVELSKEWEARFGLRVVRGVGNLLIVPYLCKYNGRDMLKRLRNQRMIVVGDSLNRNYWDSLACLLYTSIPPSTAEVYIKDTSYMDYNLTLVFYWSSYIIELDKTHESGNKVLTPDKVPASSSNGEELILWCSVVLGYSLVMVYKLECHTLLKLSTLVPEPQSPEHMLVSQVLGYGLMMVHKLEPHTLLKLSTLVSEP
ncbi:LOW QUALITY PROTEIN: hypothetical protein Cgig2_022541 [Carnegiea gigantea]|uniref:Trichome birefringence-like C-terminal domain-containing protein n=1 Tax=Carnegiea gigantea TaxID=171969 RepID=A0A9Q1GII2_9CARY|nr:LOW QUALITY PROTEIN: hypothetical protein Cgig2_022541 [Carnegiea gigantea]